MILVGFQQDEKMSSRFSLDLYLENKSPLIRRYMKCGTQGLSWSENISFQNHIPIIAIWYCIFPSIISSHASPSGHLVENPPESLCVYIYRKFTYFSFVRIHLIILDILVVYMLYCIQCERVLTASVKNKKMKA